MRSLRKAGRVKNPLDLVWTIAGIAGMLGLGFVLGRSSRGVDDQDLRDSLAVYRHDSKLNAQIQDSLRGVILAARDRVAEAEADRDRAEARARQRERNAAVFGARADSLERLLASAQTPADSIPILLAACTERRLECAELRTANADLHEAIVKDSAAKAGLREEIAAHLQARVIDSTSLLRANRLIGQLEKNALGCRLPLISIPCPTGIASYDLTAKAFSVGGGIPVKRWLTVSVTWTP